MRPNVEQIFPAYSEKHEGKTTWLYQDIKGLITTSVGVLVDPVELALPLTWMVGDRRATEQEIRDEWRLLKAQKVSSWTAKNQAKLTTIRLSDDAVDEIVTKRLRANVAYLRKRLPFWDEFPSDAHLALLSLSWAVGAGWVDPGQKHSRPALTAAVNAQDWLAAKLHAHISEINNVGVIGRNRDQELCFDNALTVKERGLDPAILFWPNAAPREPAPVDAQALIAASAVEARDADHLAKMAEIGGVESVPPGKLEA